MQLQRETRRNYSYYISDMMRKGIISELSPEGNPLNIAQFNDVPHEEALALIKERVEWGEGTRQVRAACYISLTAYLSRISLGWFRKAQPSRLSGSKTFYQLKNAGKTRALTLDEWHAFIKSLYRINKRDALIAKAILQGAQKVSEVLNLRVSQINEEDQLIYPQSFIKELEDYIGETKHLREKSDFLFLTKKGKRVFRTQLNASFNSASKRTNLVQVTPRILQSTWKVLVEKQKNSIEEIMGAFNLQSSPVSNPILF